MASLRDQFQHFYASGEDAIAVAIKTGLVVPDTNVLLSLYRFQAGARDELFGALEKAGDRLWIPYQVGLEFHRNRLNVIADQEAYFSKTEQEFNAAFDGLREKVRAFRARIAVDKGKIAQIEGSIQDLQELLGTVMNWASDGSLDMSDHASDAVRARLEALLGNRVGEPMDAKELEDARKEAKRRGDAGIPPGYKDKNKNKGDPAGDYLIFKQLMNEAKERKLPVVFITDDHKEDWYRREHGLTLGARYELREEMTAEAGVPLLIMTTETFLHHAEKYLGAKLSPETVDQAKELPGSLEIDEGRRIVSEFSRKRDDLRSRRDEIEKMRQIARAKIDAANALLASRGEDEREEARSHLHAALANAEALDAQKMNLDKEIFSLEMIMSDLRVAKSGALTISDIEITQPSTRQT